MQDDETLDAFHAALKQDDPTRIRGGLAKLDEEWRGIFAGLAAGMGALAVLTQLLVEGLDPNTRDDGDVSMLEHACESGHLAVAKKLLAAGASMDGIPLVYAAQGGSLDCVKLLLDHGAKPDQGNPGFPSALGFAEAGGLTEIAEALRRRGARSLVGLGRDAGRAKATE